MRGTAWGRMLWRAGLADAAGSGAVHQQLQGGPAGTQAALRPRAPGERPAEPGGESSARGCPPESAPHAREGQKPGSQGKGANDDVH